MSQVLMHPYAGKGDTVKLQPPSHTRWNRRGVVDAIVSMCPDHTPGEEPITYCRTGAKRSIPVQLAIKDANCEAARSNDKNIIAGLVAPSNFVSVEVQFHSLFEVFVKRRMRVGAGKWTALC